MTSFIKYWRLWAVLIFVVFADQITKQWILHNIPANNYHEPIVVLIPNVLNIVHIYNQGAAWGMFSGYGSILGLLGLVALYAIFHFRQRFELCQLPTQWIFGLLCGGIIGNIADRFLYGHVIDFIDVHLPFSIPYILENGRWPAFNIADSCICIGIILYMLINLNAEPTTEPSPNNLS